MKIIFGTTNKRKAEDLKNIINRLNLNLSGWDDIKDKAIKDAKKDYRFYSDIG